MKKNTMIENYLYLHSLPLFLSLYSIAPPFHNLKQFHWHNKTQLSQDTDQLHLYSNQEMVVYQHFSKPNICQEDFKETNKWKQMQIHCVIFNMSVLKKKTRMKKRLTLHSLPIFLQLFLVQLFIMFGSIIFTFCIVIRKPNIEIICPLLFSRNHFIHWIEWIRFPFIYWRNCGYVSRHCRITAAG